MAASLCKAANLPRTRQAPAQVQQQPKVAHLLQMRQGHGFQNV